MGVCAVLAGLWGRLCFVEIIPAPQAETVKPSKIIRTEYQYAAKSCLFAIATSPGWYIGTRQSIDVEAVQPKQVRETVKVGAIEPAKPGGGTRVDYPPKGSLRTAIRNLNKCVEELSYFPVLRARLVWMIPPTTAIPRRVAPTAAASA